MLAFNFNRLNFAVVAFVLDRYEGYFRGFPVQLRARLELARLKRNIFGNIHASVIARVQSERAISCCDFQPHFHTGTCHVANASFGVNPDVVGRNSFDCGCA